MTTGPGNASQWRLVGEPENTLPDGRSKGTISIEGLLKDFQVDPSQVETLRPDIFREGFFSVFDVLAHACGKHALEINYHFAPELGTHVIDSLAGQPDWWYAACYHGAGRCEEPVHRMDTHPYRDWMRIEVYRVSEQRVADIYSAFRDEVERLGSNTGRLTVPEVTFDVPGVNLRFTEVQVKAHGIRSDMFQDDVITAADIMLSVADRGQLSCDVSWVDRLGKTLVQSYFFTRFSDREAKGRAGFTYELGERRLFGGYQGRFGNNWLHISSDIRVILSPEYMQWRWTDLSGRRGRRAAAKGSH